MKVYKLWHSYLPHIPKSSRYTLGEKIDQYFIEFLKLLFLASKTSKEEIAEKRLCLTRASSALEVIKFLLQILWEVDGLDAKKYAALSEPIAEIGKMLGGWLRQTISRSHPATHA